MVLSWKPDAERQEETTFRRGDLQSTHTQQLQSAAMTFLLCSLRLLCSPEALTGQGPGKTTHGGTSRLHHFHSQITGKEYVLRLGCEEFDYAVKL